MEIRKYDKLWHILECPSYYDDYTQSIVHALIPQDSSDLEKELLIILYIKLIKTDSVLFSELDQKDPYNRYSVLPTLELEDLTGNISMEDILHNVRKLNILPLTRDYNLTEILLTALSELIRKI